MGKDSHILLFIATSLSLLQGFKSSGQVGIGSNSDDIRITAGEIDYMDLKRLQSTKTLFVYQEADKEDLEEMEKELRSVWTFTELVFIPCDKIRNYPDYDKYSFFTIDINNRAASENRGVWNSIISQGFHTMYFLTLHMYRTDKKGRISDDKFFCRIELYPTFKSRGVIMSDSFPYIFKANVFELFYTQTEFYNWNTGFLRNYLKTINDFLQKKEIRHVYHKETDYTALANLKYDTLFIPQNILIRNRDWHDEEDTYHDEKKLLKKYPFKYKLIPEKELGDKILSGASFYYLVYVQSRYSFKFISIFHSKSGKIVYNRFRTVDQIKSKDFRRITKCIK